MACARAPQAPLTSAPRASLGELDAGEVNCSGAAAGAGTDDTLAASQLTKERRRTRAPAQRQARNEHERACRARRATTQELHAVDSILEAVHDVIAGCTKGNAMITSLGAGDGSKATAMYQIKYASKESVEISASASVLLDAHEHIKEFASKRKCTECGQVGHRADNKKKCMRHPDYVGGGPQHAQAPPPPAQPQQ